MDSKISRWLSADPAGVEITNPNSDRFRMISGSNWYAYCENNPVKYEDPDGKCPWLAGAVVGFVTSSAAEIIPRMATEQSFTEAVKDTVHDPVALANIGSSTVLGAVTSGASALATKSVTKTGTVAARTIMVNTAGGATDAAVKDVAGKALTGQEQNLTDTAKKTAVGAGTALIFSSVTEGSIAGRSFRSSEVGNVLTGTERNAKLIPPQWSGSAGIIGETIFPKALDVANDIIDQGGKDDEK